MEAWRSGGKGIFHQAMLSLRERTRGKTEGRTEGCAAGCGQKGRKGMKLKVGAGGRRWRAAHARGGEEAQGCWCAG